MAPRGSRTTLPRPHCRPELPNHNMDGRPPADRDAQCSADSHVARRRAAGRARAKTPRGNQPVSNAATASISTQASPWAGARADKRALRPPVRHRRRRPDIVSIGAGARCRRRRSPTTPQTRRLVASSSARIARQAPRKTGRRYLTRGKGEEPSARSPPTARPRPLPPLARPRRARAHPAPSRARYEVAPPYPPVAALVKFGSTGLERLFVII